MIINTIFEIKALTAHPEGTPPAGSVYQYAFNNSVYQKNSVGVITDLGAAGSGGTTIIINDYSRFSSLKY